MWFGMIFGGGGMSADPEKVSAIKQWKVPTYKKEVKSFIQTLMLLVPFMQVGSGETYSDPTAPFRWLTETGVHFRWTEECQTTFERVKELIADGTLFRYYDPAWKNHVYVDHRPDTGICCGW